MNTAYTVKYIQNGSTILPKKLKEQIDAAIIELGKKSNETWDKSGKHTWRGGKK